MAIKQSVPPIGASNAWGARCIFCTPRSPNFVEQHTTVHNAAEHTNICSATHTNTHITRAYHTTPTSINFSINTLTNNTSHILDGPLHVYVAHFPTPARQNPSSACPTSTRLIPGHHRIASLSPIQLTPPLVSSLPSPIRPPACSCPVAAAAPAQPCNSHFFRSSPTTDLQAAVSSTATPWCVVTCSTRGISETGRAAALTRPGGRPGQP
jgi:hypothetical protein